MDLDKYYEMYKGLTDQQLLDKYESVVNQLSGKEQTMDQAFEVAGLSKLTRERGLNMVQHLQKKGRAESKENVKTSLKDLRKEAYKLLGLGLVIFLAGFGLTAATNGRGIFYGALVVGGLFILGGLFMLFSGAGMGVLAWWKFRK